MKPYSAFYYLKNNRGRAAVIIFMLFFTTLMFLGGNFTDSMFWYWEDNSKYGDNIVIAGAQSSDTDWKDYYSFIEDIKADDKLTCLECSSYGFGSPEFKTTLGFTNSSDSYVFNTKEDLEKAFDIMGIECDLSDVGDGSVVMSEIYARNLGLEKGDIVSKKRLGNDSRDFTLDALTDDNGFMCFYVCYHPENLYRVNILSDEMEGKELYDYVEQIRGDRMVMINQRTRESIEEETSSVKAIFEIGCILLAVILAVTANSVITGQFIKRTYEFGVYRALGLSKGRIFRKCAAEILLMDLVAIVIGGVLIVTTSFILNELVYLPSGRFLPYCTTTGIISFAISNLLVIVPMILSKGHQMAKADITEF